MLTISIFTRKKNIKLLNLLEDLKKQNHPSFKVKIYTDKDEKYDFETIFCEDLNIASKRNLAIKQCRTKYLFLLDDDNRLLYWKDFIHELFNFYKSIWNQNCIISPVIYFRDTNQIQSAWIKFCYVLWKVCVNKKIKWDFRKVFWIWWNSLFWELKTFKKHYFDENVWFVGEDIDYIYWLRKKWVDIFVINLWINHMEKDKTRAEKSFVQWKDMLKRKLKNRNIFVIKNWNLLEKFLYRFFGYWISLWYWIFIYKK